jgi:hypothetical protein
MVREGTGIRHNHDTIGLSPGRHVSAMFYRDTECEGQMSILHSVVNGVRTFITRLGGLFEETQVARFVTVAGSGAGFTVPDPAAPLPVSDRHIQDIDAPGLVTGSLPVIRFRTTHTGSPSFSVRLNATRLIQHAFADVGPYTWHEIVPKGALKAEDNELTLAVSGDGAVTFSDIVIFYTSNKLTGQIPFPDQVLDPG